MPERKNDAMNNVYAGDHEIVVIRLIDAPRELLWEVKHAT